MARHAGTHAAGVVVADQPLTNYVPLQRATRGDSAMTQYDMKVLDKIGLLKMDFLGLANLTMLSKALDNIRASHGIELDLASCRSTTQKTYAMLARGETRTVFQLEGSGMTRCVMDLRPSDARPPGGARGAVSARPDGAHPELHRPPRWARGRRRRPIRRWQDVLEESYGVIVYQDQVLQVVRKLAGYSLGQADVLRRAMGKKDKEVMAQEGPKFIAAGGRARLLEPDRRARVGPAAAVRRLRLQQGPRVLLCAGRVSDGVSQGELPGRVVRGRAEHDRRRHRKGGRRGGRVPARWASSCCRRTSTRRGWSSASRARRDSVRAGRGEERRRGRRRADRAASATPTDRTPASKSSAGAQDLHTVNKRVIESLIKCGALDGLGQREALLDSKRLDSAIAAAQIDQKAASTGQVSLFDMFGGAESLAIAGDRPPAVAPMNAVGAPSTRARALGEGSARLPVRRSPVHGGGARGWPSGSRHDTGADHRRAERRAGRDRRAGDRRAADRDARQSRRWRC